MLATEIVIKCVKMVQKLKGKMLGVSRTWPTSPCPTATNEIFGPSNGAELSRYRRAAPRADPPRQGLALLCDGGRLEEYYSGSHTLAENFMKSLTFAVAPRVA